MTRTIVLTAICVAVAIIVPAYRRWQLLDTELLTRIHPECFRKLTTYLEDEDDPGPEFWILSDGTRGLLRRLWRMTLVVRLLQHQVRLNHCSQEDARYVWEKAAEQVYFSLVAIPEALLCRFWLKLPHAYGLFALRCHHQLTTRTVTLCGGGNDMKLLRLL